MDDKEMKNKKQKKINTSAMILILIVIIALIIITSMAYAKYVAKRNGTATAQIATMICEMTVTSSQASESIINPYCTIAVTDEKNQKITETDVDYTIEVKAKDDAFILPEFAWKNSQGQVIARSVDILDSNNQVTGRTATFPTQHFTKGVSETQTFTIVFFNTGEEEITRNVDFKLNAIQGLAD